jgi:hypothetical protein
MAQNRKKYAHPNYYGGQAVLYFGCKLNIKKYFKFISVNVNSLDNAF